MENPVLEKSAVLDLSKGAGFVLSSDPINYDGLGKVAFFLELGLTFISGKKDYPVFYSFSTLYIFYSFYVIVALKVALNGASTEIFFFNLVRSNPPPVINSFLAFLSSYYLIFAYYCYLMCFFNASSALLCVYFLLSYSSCYFLSFSSASLCLYSSAFLLLSYYFSSLYCLFLSYSSFYL